MPPPAARNNTTHRAHSAQGGFGPPSRSGAIAGGQDSYGRCTFPGCVESGEHQHHFDPGEPPQGRQAGYDEHVPYSVRNEPTYGFYPETGAEHAVQGVDVPIMNRTTYPNMHEPQPPQPILSGMTTMERFMVADAGESPVRWFANSMMPATGLTYDGGQNAATRADATRRVDVGHEYQHDPQGRPARAPRGHNLASHHHRSTRRRNGAE